MEIVSLKVLQLALNEGQVEGLPKNPRQWTKSDLTRLGRSLQETPELFDARPCLVYPHGGKFVILGGNMRYSAAKALGWSEVPCIVFPADTPADKLREIVIKDNGSFGGWDFDDLANEWDNGQLCEWGVPVWDGDAAPADGGGAAPNLEDDEMDEGAIEVRCKRGDIWQLGEHRLMCGDSVQLDDVRKLMGGGLANMLFTDPPYGVAIGSKNKAINDAAPGRWGRIETDIAGDTLSVDELYGLLRQAMSNGREVCADDACYFVCAPPGGNMGLMLMMMRDAGLNVRHQIVWRKSSPTFSLGRLDYDYQHEAIMYTWTKSHRNHRKGACRSSVWEFNKPHSSRLHPTMKPVELVANAILDGSLEGETVLDLFGGSGTTLIAAERLGRKARIMEIDPHYCDVILSRWEQETGQHAQKINEYGK